MTSVSDILQSLRDTEGQIARLQQQLSTTPEYEALEINLLGLQKRERDLRAQFEEVANIAQTDICDYLIIPEIPDSYPVSAIGQCLQHFQELFTRVFDSVKNGPKTRGRVGAEIREQSSFNFGYAYAGSLGFTFTVPGERLLAIESDVDRATSLFVAILKCGTPDEIRELVPTVGVASITRAYELSKVHGSYALNTRVQWRRGRELSYDVVIHAPEFERLREIIDATGEEKNESFTISGKLVGLDVDTDYFHITLPDAEDIKGRLAEGFSATGGSVVPGMYKASLVKTTRLHYSTGQEDNIWTLEGLAPMA